MKKIMLPVGMAVVLLLPLVLQAAEPVATLLVVPARQRMIQLAFDMQSLRRAEVVAWRATANPEAPELNHWNGKSWDPITLSQFQTGAAFARKPQKVIFMGLETPSSLVELQDLPGVARFETFDTAVLVNNLDAFYAFTPGEWRLLSNQYGFMLKDMNERVRQQNRYANPPPPVETGPKRPPVIFDKNPPPAKVIRTRSAPAVKQAKPEPAPAPPAEIVTPEPVPSTPLEIMTAAPAGTNAVPAAP